MWNQSAQENCAGRVEDILNVAGKKALVEGASKLVTEQLRRCLLLPSLVISLFCESEVSKSASKASKDGSRKHPTRLS